VHYLNITSENIHKHSFVHCYHLRPNLRAHFASSPAIHSPVEEWVEEVVIVEEVRVVVVVVVVAEAIGLQEILVEAVGVIVGALLSVFGGAHISGGLAGISVEVVLVLETLLEVLLEVVKAGRAAVVLNPAVVVEDCARVLQVIAVRAVDDLDLVLIVPVAVPLALVDVDPEGGAVLRGLHVQVVEDAKKTLDHISVGREHVELGGGSTVGSSLAPVLVDDLSVIKVEVTASDLGHLNHKLQELPSQNIG